MASDATPPRPPGPRYLGYRATTDVCMGDPTGSRITIARKMYALRLGEVLLHQTLDALRGIEGARMRRTYRNLSERYRIPWRVRRYDRETVSDSFDILGCDRLVEQM